MTDKKLEKMRQGGEILSEVMKATIDFIRPGLTLVEAENFAADLIERKGAKASFKMVSGYRWATCINLNEGIVHGVPTERKFAENDLVSLDIGVYFRGFHTDMAYSFILRGPTTSFLKVGKKALERAIRVVREGKRVGDISEQIQNEVEKSGYSCVKSLSGHGVGKRLHEDPVIPGWLSERKEKTPFLTSGMTLAIEVIYAEKPTRILTDSDGWTMRTKNGKMAALFEKTIFVKKEKAEVLTPFSWEENARG